MIVGIGFYSYTIGSMTQMIMDFDKSEVELTEKKLIIRQFVVKQNIQDKLASRIERHIINAHMQQSYKASGQLLNFLPELLKA